MQETSGSTLLKFWSVTKFTKIFVSLFFLFLTSCTGDFSIQSLIEAKPELKMESSGGADVRAATTLTATFNEDYKDLDISKISVTNATITNLSGGPKVYTMTLTPAAEGVVEIGFSDEKFVLGPSTSLHLNEQKYLLSYDITPPATGTVTRSSPVANRSNTTSLVVGVSGVAATDTVKLYSDAACTTLVTSVVATGPTALLSPSISTSAAYTYYATVTDRAGNVSPCSASFAQYTLDVTPPALGSLALALTNPGASPGTLKRPEIQATNVSDAVSVSIYSNAACTALYASAAVAAGVADVAGTADLIDGSYTFYARLVDDLGNASACSSVSVNYVLDTTGPALAFTAPAVNALAQSGVTITGTCEAGLTIALSGTGLSSPATTTCAAGTFSEAITFTAVDGTKNIIVTQTDALGNVGSANRNFVRDNSAPVLAFSTPAASTAGINGLTITGTCEAGLTVNLSGTGLASPATTSCAAGTFSQAIVFTATDGTKNIVIGQTDAAGNAGSANRDFEKDSTAPTATLSGEPADPSNDNVLNITVGGTDVVNYRYKIGPSLTTLCGVLGDYSASTAVATLITNSLTSYYQYGMRVCVIGQDTAGNWQDSLSATAYDWVRDPNAPFAELSGLPTATSSAQALSVTVGGAGVVAYKTKVGVAASTDCAVNAGYSTESLIASPIADDISGFADGNLKLCVVGRDAAGNYQADADATTYVWQKASAALSGLSYSLGTINFILNQDIGIYKPTITVGTAPFTFGISPALPAGLTLATDTGLLTGTPTATSGATAYTITVTSATGSATHNFTMAVITDGFALASPTNESAVSGYHVFSGTCTTGETVTVATQNIKTNSVGVLPLSSQVCANSAFAIGVNFSGKVGANATVKVSQANKSVSRKVVFSPSGLAQTSGTRSLVTVAAKDPATGKVYIGGTVTGGFYTEQKYLYRLNADGSFDDSFMLAGTGLNAAVAAIAVDSSSRVYISGSFTSLNGTTQNRIARLKEDGSLDTTFVVGTGFNNAVTALLLDSAGKLVVSGSFTSYNGTSVPRLVRLANDGSIDATFTPGTGIDSGAVVIAEDASSRLLLGGSFSVFDGVTATRIVRLNANGTRDGSFVQTGVGFISTVQGITFDSSGNIIVTGNFTMYGSDLTRYIVRLNSSGARDASFAPTGTGLSTVAYKAMVESSGDIVVVGNFSSYNGAKVSSVVRLNSDGTLKKSLNEIGTSVRGLLAYSANKIFVYGVVTAAGADGVGNYAMINSDGSLDRSFTRPSISPNGNALGIVIDQSGKTVINGSFSTVAGVRRPGLARLNLDGSVDSTFVPLGAGFTNTVEKIIIEPSSGKYIVVGALTAYNGVGVSRIARLNTDGTLDASFSPSGAGISEGYIYDVAVDSNGKIVVAGSFTKYNYSLSGYVIRLNADGTRDTSFNLEGVGGTGGNVYGLAVDANDKILLAGDFGAFNGDTSKKYLVRLNTNGSVDGTFTPGAFNLYARKVTVDSNGKILIGGNFTTIGATSVGRIARLNSDGTLDPAFQVTNGFDSEVSILEFQSDGKILAGGGFSLHGASPISRVVRLNTDGTLDRSFVSGLGSAPTRMVIRANGNMLISASSGSNYGATSLRGLVEVSASGSLLNTMMSATAGSTYLAMNATTTVTGQNGTAPYSYSVISGAGLINNTTGVFTAPATPGISVVRVNDSAGKSATLEISYSANTLAIAPTSFSVAKNGTYSLSAVGGYPPYTFSVIQGGGSVTSSGVYTAGSAAEAVKIQVTDSMGEKAIANGAVTEGLALSPSYQNLYPGESVTFQASGGSSPYTYSVLSGAGTIASMTGVYTAGANAGTSVIQAVDSKGLSVESRIYVNAPTATLAISPATVNTSVGGTFKFGAVGGTPPYTYTLVSGVGSVSASGNYSAGGSPGSAVVRVTDSVAATANANVTVNATLALSVPYTSVVASGSVTLSASGGVPPYTYGVASGGGSIGSVSGIYTAPNNLGVAQIFVKDSANNQKYVSLNIVEPLRVAVSATTLSRLGYLQLQVSGGTASYTYSIDSGVGSISSHGSYTSAVVGSATLRVTDTAGNAHAFSVTIVPILPELVYNSTSSVLYVGGDTVSWLPTLAGDPATSFAISPSLPSGMSFNTSTGEITGSASAARAATNYTVTATNAGGSATTTLTFASALAASFAVTDPVESQVVSGHHVFTGNCEPGSTVAFSSASSNVTVSSAAGICFNGKFYMPVKIDGTTGQVKVISVRSANKEIQRTVTFNPTNRALGAGFAGYVKTIVRDPVSGKFYVGGEFTSFGVHSLGNIARLNADGTLDTTFVTGTGFTDSGGSGLVHSIALDSAGKIYVGGSFGYVNGSLSSYFTRLNTDGSKDFTFNSSMPNQTITKVLVDSNDKPVVLGSFTSIGGTTRRGLARFNTDGTLDASFNLSGGGFDSELRDFIIDASGKIVVVGGFDDYDGSTCSKVARLNADGTLDGTFNIAGTGLDAYVAAIKQDSGGKYVIGGAFNNYNGTAKKSILRLNSNGALDTGFAYAGAGPNGYVMSLEIDSAGKVLIVGGFNSFDGVPYSGLAKLNADGTLDSAFNGFGSGIAGNAYDLTVDASDNIYWAGSLQSYNGTQLAGIAKSSPTGVLDTSFSPVPKGFFGGTARASVVDSTGRMYVGGNFDSYNGVAVKQIVRFNADGSLDNSFNLGSGFDSVVTSLSIDGNGKLLVAGDFGQYQGVPYGGIVRLNDDATVDGTFNPGSGFNGNVRTAVLDASGKILVGGNFTTYNGTSRPRLARLNTDGSVDTGFALTGTGFNGDVYSIAVDGNGKVYAGGTFNQYNGNFASAYVARLNTDGSLDTGFAVTVNSSVESLAVDSSDRVVIGGNFTTVGGITRYRIARLQTNGDLDAAFIAGSSPSSVAKVIISPDGKIYMSGELHYGETKRLLKLNPDGSLDPLFYGGKGMPAYANSMSLDVSGNLYMTTAGSSYAGSTTPTGVLKISPLGSLLP